MSMSVCARSSSWPAIMMSRFLILWRIGSSRSQPPVSPPAVGFSSGRTSSARSSGNSSLRKSSIGNPRRSSTRCSGVTTAVDFAERALEVLADVSASAVNVNALQSAWEQETPDAHSLLLLQALWLNDVTGTGSSSRPGLAFWSVA